MNKIEIEVNKLISIINDKITQYYSIYHCEPKVILSKFNEILSKGEKK